MGIELESYIPLRTISKSVDADCYNRVRLALVRLEDPLHLELKRFRVEFTLERKVWLAVSTINEFPLLAWTEFQTRNRPLHAPVQCLLHMYHIHSGLLMGRVLEAMDGMLQARLIEVTPLATQDGKPNP